MSHVIEHVSYPKVIIKEIKQLMNQDSILYIEIPLEKILTNIWKKKGGGLVRKKYWLV